MRNWSDLELFNWLTSEVSTAHPAPFAYDVSRLQPLAVSGKFATAPSIQLAEDHPCCLTVSADQSIQLNWLGSSLPNFGGLPLVTGGERHKKWKKLWLGSESSTTSWPLLTQPISVAKPFDKRSARCNNHCLCSESQGVWRQVRWGGCGTGTVSRVSGKAMDRFQCTWIAMIGEIYEVDCWISREWVQLGTY